MYVSCVLILAKEKWSLKSRFASLPGWSLRLVPKSTGRLSTSNLSELGSILRHPPGFSRAEDAGSDLQLYRGEQSSAAIWVPVKAQRGRATGMNCV